MKKFISVLMVITLLLSVGCAKKESTDTKEVEVTKEVATETNEEVKVEEPQEIVNLKVYTYNVDQAEALNAYAVEKVEQEFPVKIEIIHRSDSTGEELKTFAAIGELPDIIELKAANVLEAFKQSGDIIALDDSLEKYGVYDYVDKQLVDTFRNSDGNLYVYEIIPPVNYLLYYNKAVFDKYNVPLPTNYDMFLSAVKTFSDNGITPLALFGSEIWPGFQFMDYLITRQNPNGWRDIVEGKASMTDSAYAEAAKKLSELLEAGLISKTAFTTNASQAIEMWTNGQAAMIGNGTWYFPRVNAAIDLNGTEFGYLDNPLSVPGQEEATMFNRSGRITEGGFTVSAKGKNVELATEVMHAFIKYKAEADAKLYGGVNVLKYDIQPDKEKSEVILKYEAEIPKFKALSIMYPGVKNPEVKTAIGDASQALWSGAITVEEFAKLIDDAVKANPVQ